MTTASITITANDKTQAAFRSIENSLSGISGRMNVVMGAVAGLAGAAGFGMLVKSSMQSADALAKTSDALGIATEKLASMRYMGDLAGVSAEQMDANLKKMTQSLGEAAQGGGAAAKTLEALHLDTAKLVQLSPDQQYLAIADAINGLGTQAEKAAAANDIFGRSGVNMLNVMAGGSETFLKAEEEAKNFGIAISRLDAAKIEMANDSFTRLGTVVQGMGNAVAITAAPMLEDLANRFVNMIGGADGFRNAAQFMTDVTVNAVGLLADGFHGLHIVFDGIGAAFWTVVEDLMKGLDWLQKQVVEFMNLLPGVDIKPMESFTKATQFAADTAESARRNLQALVMEPLPSDKIKQWSQDVQQKADEAAAKVAAVSQAAGGQVVLDTSSSANDIKTSEADDRERQRMQDQLERLQQHYMSKQELLAKNFENEQFMIEESFQNNLLTDQERRDLLLSSEQEYQNGLTAIADEEAKKRAAIEKQYTDVVKDLKSSVFNHAIQLLEGLGGKSKSAAKIAIVLQKAITIAQIKMQSTTAAWAALQPPPIGMGPIAGASLAASIKGWALADMGMVAGLGALELSNVNTGGGGTGSGGSSGQSSGSPSSGYSNSATMPMPEQRSGSINIYIQGAITEDMIRDVVVPVIKEDVDNRDLVLISSNSRNGQVLMGS
jgi:hypothetical protein